MWANLGVLFQPQDPNVKEAFAAVLAGWRLEKLCLSEPGGVGRREGAGRLVPFPGPGERGWLVGNGGFSIWLQTWNSP